MAADPITVATIAQFLEDFAPLSVAAEWDNVGLLLGDASKPVQRVMTCLTVTPRTATEAQTEGAQLIVSHHPILFRPVQRLTSGTAEGAMLYALARAGIAVYSPHTAFDNTRGGINDLLAQRLELTGVEPLTPSAETRQCKIVVFVPDADLAKVSDGLFAAGAGNIGQYSQCSFRLAGTGTFFGSDAANPAVGQKGRREDVSEWRLEVVCPEGQVDQAIRAMRQAHSYEEPAFDVYPLRPGGGKRGVGRIGSLPQPMRLDELARLVAERLPAPGTSLVGDSDRLVERVAIVCGAGGDLVDAAARKADVLLTGEARFHDCLKAEALGLGLILPGHHASERVGVEELARLLGERFPGLAAWPSRGERDPVQSVGGVRSEIAN